MQSAVVRFGCALWMVVTLAVSSSEQSGATSRADAAPQVVASELIYAAQNAGTIHVYDVDHHHAEVQGISLFSCCADARGLAVAVPPLRLSVLYRQGSQGHA